MLAKPPGEASRFSSVLLASLQPSLPVIGLPCAGGPLNGVDALHSIVQMPPGIPVATVGIGNGKNAGYLAAHIVAIADPAVREKLVAYRKSLGDIEG